MVRFKDIFLWAWQSPQNVLGRFLAAHMNTATASSPGSSVLYTFPS